MSEIQEAISKINEIGGSIAHNKKTIEFLMREHDARKVAAERHRTFGGEGGISGVPVEDDSDHYKAYKAFVYAKTGGGVGLDVPKVMEFMESGEYKVLSEATDTAGGFLVPEGVETEIIKKIVEVSPMRAVARITMASTNKLPINRRISGPTGTWEGESGSGTESTSVYQGGEIPLHAQMVLSRATCDQLEDVPNMEAEIGLDASEELARLEGVAFISGDGVSKPMGVITNAGTDADKYPATVTGEDTSTHLIEANDLHNLIKTLKPAYRRDAVFMFNSNIFGSMLKWVEATTNAYIWGTLAQGAPLTLLGKPFLFAEDLADDGTADNMTVVLGDMFKGYRIADRSGIRLVRDPYSAKPDIDFQFRRRVGGQVVLPEAIKVLTMG